MNVLDVNDSDNDGDVDGNDFLNWQRQVQPLPFDRLPPFRIYNERIGHGTTQLTLTETAKNYDWSGSSINSLTKEGVTSFTARSACSLISKNWAVGAMHAGPSIGDIVNFRLPTGLIYKATVKSVKRVLATDIKLVEFTQSPPVELKRYAVLSAQDHARFIGQHIWIVEHDGDIELRLISGVSNYISHTTSWWKDYKQNYVTSSGRPAFMPINGELAILGCNYTSSWFPKLAGYHDYISSVMIKEEIKTIFLP
jgi:hypothetical protein